MLVGVTLLHPYPTLAATCTSITFTPALEGGQRGEGSVGDLHHGGMACVVSKALLPLLQSEQPALLVNVKEQRG